MRQDMQYLSWWKNVIKPARDLLSSENLDSLLPEQVQYPQWEHFVGVVGSQENLRLSEQKESQELI
jgi:hypothetical protein